MKLSNGLKNMLAPILPLLDSQLDFTLHNALRRVGKRGNRTYYPTDLKRLNVVLECQHDVTGKQLEVEVKNCDFENALFTLSSLILFEDFVAESLTN